MCENTSCYVIWTSVGVSMKTPPFTMTSFSLASQPLFFFLVRGGEKKKTSGDFSQVFVGCWNAIT